LLGASASDKNQCSFRHSCRSRPLKRSTIALSVGVPRREAGNAKLKKILAEAMLDNDAPKVVAREKV